MVNFPNLDFEIKLWDKGYLVIGIDEVGRGAFAGPLFAAGVIFNPKSNIQNLLSYGINDSKKLKPNARKKLAKVIQHESLVYHISHIDVPLINRVGIGKSTHAVMRDVVKNLREKLKSNSKIYDLKPNNQLFVIVDGFPIKNLRGIERSRQQGIVGGDSLSLSIAAASVIAKVARDNHMKHLAAKYRMYGWGKNKGYGTLSHRQALAKHGPTPLHRIDFIENFVST